MHLEKNSKMGLKDATMQIGDTTSPYYSSNIILCKDKITLEISITDFIFIHYPFNLMD